MQKTTLLAAIQQILEQQLNIPYMASFHEKALLREDLGLDSVLLMQLLISIELEFGITVPDSALTKKDFESVAGLIDFLLRQTEQSSHEIEPEQTTAEEFEDIKVHCFVSCVCEIIKADTRVDHRPFYFGVWDAEIVINENHCLAYHAAGISHDFFIQWYQKLYGVPLVPWYRHDLDKADNIKNLLALLKNKTAEQHIMVMLDMFRLPERENKFNQDPFPHYVMLENTTDPETLMMYDPDFRWQGTQPKAQVLHAIESAAVAGGYHFDSRNIQPYSNDTIRDYFLACFNEHHNPMTDAARKIIAAHTGNSASVQVSNLSEALAELPVLAIRKYAYEHGLAYFWDALKLDGDEFESWCDVIEELVSGYKKIQYRAMKIASATNSEVNQQLLAEIEELLNQQDDREFRIKNRLQEVFEQWCQLQELELRPEPKQQHSKPQLLEACL